MALALNEILVVFESIEAVIQANKQFLTDLDAAIGDGDHGINLCKGFKAASERLASTPLRDWGDMFKLIGMAIVSNVGGASGPLYGTAFIKAAPLGAGKTEITLGDLREILNAGINGIKLRGGAEKGDKTMLDALIPAFEEINKGMDNNLDIITTLDNAFKASQAGVEYTKTIAARKGRASYLGDRSIGHQDPGATSSSLIMEAIYETVKSLRG